MIALNTNHISTHTLTSKILGHISLTFASSKINNQKEIILLLQHLVLTSHGKYHFESTRK